MALPQVGVQAVIQNLASFTRGASTISRALRDINRASDQAGSRSGALSSQLDTLGSSILSVSGTIANVAVGAIELLVGALFELGAAAVREGAAYTKEMSNVAAVSGAVGKEFDALAASAEELGRTTKFTAVEAAEGMSFLAMAGFEVNEIIAAMPGVLNLASAGNLELGRASDIVSNILSGFGADASQTTKFVDVLTKTFTSSNTSLQQLGQGMKFIAPVAKTLGFSVEDLAAAMGILGDAGIQGALAGTSLRGILLALASPSQKAENAMRELGLFTDETGSAFFDLEGNMLSLPAILTKVQDATKDLTQEQSAQFLKTLVGTRRLSAFNVLLDAGPGKLQTFGDELRDSVGTASEIAAKQLDNLSGDVTLFQSAMRGVKIDIFKQLEPVLRDVVKRGGELLKVFGPQLVIVFGEVASSLNSIITLSNELFDIFQTFGVEGLVSSLGLTPQVIELANKIAGSFTNLANTILSTLIPSFQGLADGGFLELLNQAIIFLNQNFVELEAVILTIGRVLAGAVIRTIILGIVSAIGLLFTPIGLLIAGMSILSAAWAGNWGNIQGITKSTIKSISKVIDTAFSTIENIVASFSTTFQELFVVLQESGVEGLALALGITPETIALITQAGQVINDFVFNVIDIVQELFAVFQESGFAGLAESLGISPEIIAMITEFVTVLEGVGQSILDFIQNVLPTLTGEGNFFEDLFSAETLENIVVGLINAVPDILSGIVDAMTTFFSDALPTILGALDTWGDNFWNWVQTVAVPNAGLALAGLLGALLEFATSSEAQSKLLEMGEAIGTTLTDAIKILFENTEVIGAIMIALAGALLASVAVIGAVLITTGGQIVAGIIAGAIEALGGPEVEVLTINEMGKLVESMINDTPWADVGLGLVALIVEGIRDATLSLQEGAQDIVDEIKETITELSDQIKTIGSGIVAGIVAGIVEAKQEVVQAIQDILDTAITETKTFLGISSPSTLFAGFGADIIQGFINGITENASSLISAFAGIFTNLFPGGEGEEGGGFSLDFTAILAVLTTELPEAISTMGIAFTEALASINLQLAAMSNFFAIIIPAGLTTFVELALELLETLRLKVEENDFALQNIFLVTLVSLTDAMTVYVEAAVELLEDHRLKVVEVDDAFILITTKTIPALKKAIGEMVEEAIDQFDDMIKKIGEVVTSVEDLGLDVEALGTIFTTFGDVALQAVDTINDEMEELIEILENVERAANAAAAAMDRLRETREGRGLEEGTEGARAGVGFQSGTLGVTIPPGFPNDSFPINLTSGEELLVTPVGTSIMDVFRSVFDQLAAPITAIIQGVNLGEIVATAFQNFFGEEGVEKRINDIFNRVITSKINELFDKLIGDKLETAILAMFESLQPQELSFFGATLGGGQDSFSRTVSPIEPIDRQALQGDRIVPLSFNVTINNDMDLEIFTERVRRTVSEAFGA